jgi:hypothetical protein
MPMTRSVPAFRQLARAVILITAAVCGWQPAAQETVPIENVPGKKIDGDWHRYLNARYGVGVDIPAKGFTYELSDNGDGVTLASADGEKSIAVYGSQDIELAENAGDPQAAFAAVAEAQIDAMRLGSVNIVEDRVERLWFEISTTDALYLYYQKGLLSPDCPTFTANLWIKYPNSARAEFEAVRQRMAMSLKGNCPGRPVSRADGPEVQ